MANTIKCNFKLSELNSKIRSLESNGFEEYLNTWEKETVNGDLDMNHIIMTATKGNFNGAVCDIYFNEKTGVCWLEYSGKLIQTRHNEGDTVKIENGIIDPMNRQGQNGVVYKVERGEDEDDDIIHVRFQDGFSGKYMHRTLTKQPY